MKDTHTDDSHLHLLAGIQFRPVFIMGHPRSGTTLLYELLAATGCFNIVDVYHLLHFHELLDNHLQQREEQVRNEIDTKLQALGVSDRGFDAVKVHSRTPTEYLFRMWHAAGSRVIDMFTGTSLFLNERTLPAFNELARKVQFISGPERPLLLKNPVDWVNYRFIKKMFPDARFVFIHRHPARALDSALRAVRQLLASCNQGVALLVPQYPRVIGHPVWRPLLRWCYASPPQLGLRALAWNHVQMIRSYLEDCDFLPQGDYTSLRYEDLCANADDCMRNVLRFLDVPSGQVQTFADRVRPRSVPLLREVRSEYARIKPKLRPYLERFHYESLR